LIDLLTILQHADSSFPSGSFAFSNGIEGLSAKTAELNRRGLQDVVTMFLRHRWTCFALGVSSQSTWATVFRMDPEDLREVISAYQKCVAETVVLRLSASA
jgi:urease accessory protein UreF